MAIIDEQLTITIGAETFCARWRRDLAPHSCKEFEQLLPYGGDVIHARWSGEAIWTRLASVWPRELCLPAESATSRPCPGDLLLFAGEGSEPELLVVYGSARFACKTGPLKGNPVLVIEDDLERLAMVGQAVLQSGAMTIRIQQVAPIDSHCAHVHNASI
jgi:hypothetical protein